MNNTKRNIPGNECTRKVTTLQKKKTSRKNFKKKLCSIVPIMHVSKIPTEVLY